jgi:hypothetical protein
MRDRARPRRGGHGGYAALLATNVVLGYLATAVLDERHDFELGCGLFFAFLIATIIWLYGAFRPVYCDRLESAPSVRR